MTGDASRPARRAVRGRVLSFTGDPAQLGADASHRYHEDGLVLIEDGRIAALGEARDLLPRLPAGCPVDHHAGHLVLPGLIDPKRARLLASVAPEVKTISPGRAPSSAATCSRACSTASAARQPARWVALCGLPTPAGSSHGSIAARTRGSSGVVA